MKNVFKPVKDWEALSVAGTLKSGAFSTLFVDNVGFGVQITGSDAAGALSIEVSFNHEKNPDGSVRVEGDWETVGDESGDPLEIEVAAGSPAVSVLEANQITAPYTRLSWVPTTIQSSVITTVADDSSSLNSTYFLLDGADGDLWYVWIDVDDTGVDPNIDGRTGIEVDISEDDTADDVATALATALAACTSIENVMASTDEVSFDQTEAGAGSMEDGEAPTGFSFVDSFPEGTISAQFVAKQV
jgi:hypothetical protein